MRFFRRQVDHDYSIKIYCFYIKIYFVPHRLVNRCGTKRRTQQWNHTGVVEPPLHPCCKWKLFVREQIGVMQLASAIMKVSIVLCYYREVVFDAEAKSMTCGSDRELPNSAPLRELRHECVEYPTLFNVQRRLQGKSWYETRCGVSQLAGVVQLRSLSVVLQEWASNHVLFRSYVAARSSHDLGFPAWAIKIPLSWLE